MFSETHSSFMLIGTNLGFMLFALMLFGRDIRIFSVHSPHQFISPVKRSSEVIIELIAKTRASIESRANMPKNHAIIHAILN